jgi:phosphoglycolate phosphatase-like HAD superfamily hydrolase
MKRAIIFDKDGTLFSMNRMNDYWLKSVVSGIPNYACSDSAYRLGQKMVKHSTWDEILDKMTMEWSNNCHITYEQAQTILRERVPNDQWKYQEPLTDIPNLLKKMRDRDFVTILYTNDNRNSVEKILDTHNIRFDDVLCGDDFDGNKHHPSGIWRILNKFQIEPRNSIIVGDSECDVSIGQKASIGEIYFIGETAHSYATKTIKSVDEIIFQT